MKKILIIVILTLLASTAFAQTTVSCPDCHKIFNPENYAVSAAVGGAIVGGAAGFYAGGSFGLATGGWGIPAVFVSTPVGGLIGGLTGWICGSKFTKCPNCGKTFKY